MTSAANTGGSTMKFQPAINTTPDTSNANLSKAQTAPGNISLTGANLTAGNKSSTGTTPYVSGNPTAGNKSSTGTASGVGERKPIDYKDMKKPAIQNLSGLDKMFRNANRKNTNTQKFFNGTVDRPTTILPMEKPMDVIKPADKNKVIKDSVNMTKSGTNLRTLFWDL
jgi:hypothetical protein